MKSDALRVVHQSFRFYLEKCKVDDENSERKQSDTIALSILRNFEFQGQIKTTLF